MQLRKQFRQSNAPKPVVVEPLTHRPFEKLLQKFYVHPYHKTVLVIA